jgi:hypothetical protein
VRDEPELLPEPVLRVEVLPREDAERVEEEPEREEVERDAPLVDREAPLVDREAPPVDREEPPVDREPDFEVDDRRVVVAIAIVR